MAVNTTATIIKVIHFKKPSFLQSAAIRYSSTWW